MVLLRTRRGVVLLWILAAIALIAVLAATTAPYVAQYDDTVRVQKTAAMLANVATAVDDFNLIVKNANNTFMTPNTLNDLTSPIANNDQGGCSTTKFNNTAVTAWNGSGPFGPYVMPTTGLETPIGKLNNAPSRSATTVGTQRTSTNDPYWIQIQSVRIGLARLLDAYVDGTTGQSAGTMQYTNPVGTDSLVTISYNTALAHTPAC